MQNKVLFFINGNYTAIERDQLDSNYKGPIYNLPLYNQKKNQQSIEKKANKKNILLVGHKNTTDYYHAMSTNDDETAHSCLTNESFVPDFNNVNDENFKFKYSKTTFDQQGTSSADGIIMVIQTKNDKNDAAQCFKWLEKNRPNIPVAIAIIDKGVYVHQNSPHGYNRDDKTLEQIFDKDFSKLEKYSVFNLNDQKGLIDKRYFINATNSFCDNLEPDIKLLPKKNPEQFIKNLNAYIERRNSNAKELYHGFWSLLGGGFTRDTKIKAATMLLSVLKGENTADFLQPYEKALNQGELGKLYKQIKQNDLIQPLESLNDSIKTINII